MKALQSFLFLFSPLFVLIVLAATLPAKLTPENAEKLDWSDLLNYGGNQEEILRQYQFEDLGQPSRQTSSVQDHLNYIENHLMQDNPWEGSPSNPQIDARGGQANQNSKQITWQDTKWGSPQKLEHEPTQTFGSILSGASKEMSQGMHDTYMNFLINIGTWDIQIPKSLLKRIRGFFSECQKEIIATLQRQPPDWTTSEEISSGPGLGILRWRVERSILIMQRRISPAFIAVLWLTHQNQVNNDVWISMCQSAWYFLEHVFGLWKEHILIDPRAVLKNPEKNKFKTGIWSYDPQLDDLMNFILEHHELTDGRLWYLVNQCYGRLYVEPGSGYPINPPSRSLIQDLYTKHQRRLLE